MPRYKYKLFLRSKEWKDLREIYRNNPKYQCFVCGTKTGLNLHHISYSKNLTDPINIVVLCLAHHKQSHFKKTKFRYTTGFKSIKTMREGLSVGRA